MQNFSFAHPERSSAREFSSQCGNAKLRFRRITLNPRVRFSFWACKTLASLCRREFAAHSRLAERKLRQLEYMCAIWFTSRPGNAKRRFRHPRMNVHHRVRISFWEWNSQASTTQNERAPQGSHLVLSMQNLGHAKPK